MFSESQILVANTLSNYVSMSLVLVTGATAADNSQLSSVVTAVPIASTCCDYPQRDGQAELAGVASTD